MTEYRRTHHCGELRKSNINDQVRLSGWVHRRRDHGGLIFIDLRDRFGLTQLVFDPKVNKEAHQSAEALRAEWVLTAQGKVIPRAEGMANSKLDTGDIEVEIDELSILSRAKTPPFSVCDDTIVVNEELRLRHRYLDIRRGEIAKNLLLRNQMMQSTRRVLSENGFIEVQTPILGKSTPEGARDYLVPSRVHPGTFYALPQSPQLFKQLLMLSGMDRYFQIATCFRDEDLRADRQPEFTQIDIEMSFDVPEGLFAIVERLVQTIFKEGASAVVAGPFRRITFDEALENYGTDKPDLRFGMELKSLNDIAERSEFSIFQEQIRQGGIVKGICVKGGADASRRIIDEYTAFVGKFGVKGLAWMKYQDTGLASSIVKFFSDDLQSELIERMGLEQGDLLLMVADQRDRALQALDHLRRKLARDRDLIKSGQYEMLWVTDYPLFTLNDDGQMESEHHPFTSPRPEDIPLMNTDPLKVRSSSYDLVCNGYECASGSLRIHDSDLQKSIFKALRLTPEEIEAKFGFFTEALNYGTPPHLGIALGLDRLTMILADTDNIRDVIAFPKTQRASDLMMEAPSSVGVDQLNDLNISLQEGQFSLS